MSKIDYGVDNNPKSEDDDGWTKLATIVKRLKEGEPVPPYLAHWLGRAIERSERDPEELLRLLGLRPRRGRPREKYTEQFAMQIGRYICELEDSGLRPDKALKEFERQYRKYYEDRVYGLEEKGLSIDQAVAEVEEEISWDTPSLTTLKQWRNNYRQVMEHHEWGEENP